VKQRGTTLQKQSSKKRPWFLRTLRGLPPRLGVGHWSQGASSPSPRKNSGLLHAALIIQSYPTPTYRRPSRLRCQIGPCSYSVVLQLQGSMKPSLDLFRHKAVLRSRLRAELLLCQYVLRSSSSAVLPALLTAPSFPLFLSGCPDPRSTSCAKESNTRAARFRLAFVNACIQGAVRISNTESVFLSSDKHVLCHSFHGSARGSLLSMCVRGLTTAREMARIWRD